MFTSNGAENKTITHFINFIQATKIIVIEYTVLPKLISVYVVYVYMTNLW